MPFTKLDSANNAIICIKQNGSQKDNFAERKTVVCSNDVTILSSTEIQMPAANTANAF